MAQQTTVYLEDDLDGSEADETIEFALDGVTYEIDLSQDNADELRDQLAVYIENGRRVGGRARRGTARSTNTTRGKYNRETLAQMRSWARGQGMTVSDRGRVPTNVIDAWEQAHKGNAA